MADRAISVRLDADAARALDALMASGDSQSEAIRNALLGAAATRQRERLAAEAIGLAADQADRAVVADVQEFMDRLSAAW